MRGLGAILVAYGLLCLRGWAIDPAQVIILVNDDDHESIDLGYYYALKRDVPVENIVHLPLPADEIISWDIFLDSLYNPLVEWLIDRGWLEGFSSRRKTPAGKHVTVVSGHTIGALVICRGVPLRIANDPDRLPPREAFGDDRHMFYTNRASVDSELALISLPQSNIEGVVVNPMFHRTQPRRLFDVKPVVVGRLDGPAYASARKMLDNALYAEDHGIAGRVYIDLRGPHEGGDDWLTAVADRFESEGFEVDRHEKRGRFNLVDRFDQPLFYFGWYSGFVDGPFTHYGFEFPPGAIALHIHSFTAASVRSGSRHWLGPLVARGVTGTMGNTSEPYLFYTHQPQLFVEGLFKGLTAGEAALYALYALSWTPVYLGDPLFKPPLDIEKTPENEYGVLRMANLAMQAGDASAFKVVDREFQRSRHFAPGLWLHGHFLEKGDKEKAYTYLDTALRPPIADLKSWGVLVEFAEGLCAVDRTKEGIDLLQSLLDHIDNNRILRVDLLERVVDIARRFKLGERGQAWQEELDRLVPSMVPAPKQP